MSTEPRGHPKKILFIINGLNLGGAETALYRLLCSLQSPQPTAKQNQTVPPYDERQVIPLYQFNVIVLNEKGYYSEAIEEMGITIHYLAIRKKPLRGFFQLLRLIKQIQPEIVQTWLYHADLVGGVAAKLCGVPIILWGVRCEGTGLKKSTHLIKRVCAILSWFIPTWIIINSTTALTHHQKLGYHSKKFKLIPNGFDSRKFSPTTDIHEIKLPVARDTALLFGTLARFHEDKDYFNLIQAIDNVCLHHPHAYFVLCGPGCHQNNKQLATMLKTLRAPQHVLLINGVADAAAYLNQLDVFILSSKTEGFPNSLAEAMLCGLPCVATAVGEAPDMLGECGLLVPKQNPEALAHACITLIHKPPSERATMGKLARSRIEQRYSSANNQKLLQALYEDRPLCVE